MSRLPATTRWLRVATQLALLPVLTAGLCDKSEKPCKDPTAPSCPEEVTSLELAPGALSVARGSDDVVTVRGRTRSGNTAALSIRSATVQPANIADATRGTGDVRVTGRVRGNAVLSVVGNTTAGAELSGTVSIRVLDVSSVDLADSAISMVVGDARSVPITIVADPGIPTTVTFASTNPGVATVNAGGLITALSTGTTIISATSTFNATLRDQVTVTVTAAGPVLTSVRIDLSPTPICAGRSVRATAVPLSAQGLPMSTTGFNSTWTSTSPAVLTATGAPDPLSLDLIAVSPGSTGLGATVSGGGRSASATANVAVQPLVSSVSVTLAKPAIGIGEVSQGTTTILDCRGQALAGQAVTWTSDNSAIATVSQGGAVTGVALGSTTIRASAGGQSGSASIAVTGDPVASMTTISAPTLTNETILSPVLDRPAVRLVRQSGARASGEVVRFRVTAGGGTLGDTDVTTDANGEARVASWTMGGASGANTVTATYAGLAAATFTATAKAPIDSWYPQALPDSLCRATIGCSFVMYLKTQRNQPMVGLPVLFTPEVGNGTSFSPANGLTASDGTASTTWNLPARGVYRGTARIGSTDIAICREAFLPASGESAARGTVLQLQRQGAPRRVGNVTITMNPVGGGVGTPLKTLQATQPRCGTAADSVGDFDFAQLSSGNYNLTVAAEVGVVRSVTIYGARLLPGSVSRVGAVRVPQGNSSGPVDLCMTGPLSNDPSTVVTVYKDIGGDGSEDPARFLGTSNPNGAGCVTISMPEGVHLVHVDRTGYPRHTPHITVDYQIIPGTFKPVITIALP